MSQKENIQIKSVKNTEFSNTLSQKQETKSDLIETLGQFIKSYIGSGILALPFALQQCGIFYGLIVTFILLVLTSYIIKKLIKLTESVNLQETHYSDLGDIVVGKKFGTFINILIYFLQFGVCVSYIIFFIQFFKDALFNLGYHMPHFLILLITLLILSPFILIRNFSFFVSASYLATLLIFLSIIRMCWVGKDLIEKEDDEKIKNIFQYKNFEGVPLFYGVAIYAFEGIGTIFHLRESMEQKQKFFNIFLAGSILIFFLYSFFQSVILLAYGNQIQQIALLNLSDQESIFNIIAKIAYAFGILLTFPLQIFPCYSMIEKFLQIDEQSSKNDYNQIQNQKQNDNIELENEISNFQFNKKFFIFYGVRLLQIIFIFIIAFFIPQFSDLLSFIGGTSGTALQFCIPCFLYLKHFHNNLDLQEKIVVSSIFILSIIMTLMCIYSSIEKIKN